MRHLFWIEARHSGKVLDVPGGSLQGSVKIIQFTKKSADDYTVNNQLWYFDDKGFIYNQNSGLVIDVTGSGFKDGTEIIQYQQYDDAQNQQWTYNVYDLTISLKAYPNYVLDVPGSSQDEGAPIILYTKQASLNQQFILTYCKSVN